MTPLRQLADAHPELRQPDGSYPPDAMRLMWAASGNPSPRPFHLRWLLPEVCGRNVRAWWVVWLASWGVLATSTVAWRLVEGDGWWRSLAVAALLLGLPGILGPASVIPVGVDLPATALAVTAAAFAAAGGRWVAIGVIVVLWAACAKETAPFVAALAAWCPWLLLGLVAPLVRHVWCVRHDLIGRDPLGPKFQSIADHPVRASLEAHAGRWRDAWLHVAPWGVCLAALYRPTPQVIVALVAAWAVLMVATDTVRLVHHMAGPVMAAAAVANIPTPWLAVAVVAHIWWWRTPERI